MNSTFLAGPYPRPATGLWQRIWQHLHDHVVPHARNHYQPHLLHHRTLTAVSVLLLTIKLVSVSALEFSSTASVEASAITSVSVLGLTNDSRLQAGLSALTYNQVLERAAQLVADDLLAKQYFAHNSPDGRTPWSFFEEVGYKYLNAGQNLAVHFSDVEPLQAAWMNSPGHKANILNSSFREMGVGISKGKFEGHDSMFVVEMFGNPAGGVSQPHGAVATPTPALVTQAKPSPTPAKLVKPNTATAADLPIPSFPSAPAVPVQATSTMSASSEAMAASIESEKLGITQTNIKLSGGMVTVSAKTSADISKLLLAYGPRARFFRAQGDGVWTVSVPSTSLQQETLTVRAYDLQGASVSLQLASLASSLEAAHAGEASVQSAYIDLWGQRVPVQPLEHKAYLGIIAILLTGLVIVLAVRRHVHHVRLIANTAFVVAFAALLLLF